MADETDEKLDVLFGELASKPAFPVDWEQYERELMQRIWRQQAERRKRTAWVGVASAISGAVATFVATIVWMAPPPQPQLPAAPPQNNAAVPAHAPRQHEASDEQPALRVVRREDGSLDISNLRVAAAESKPLIPFTRRSSSNGRPYQISFSGYTPEGVNRPSVIEPIKPVAE